MHVEVFKFPFCIMYKQLSRRDILWISAALTIVRTDHAASSVLPGDFLKLSATLTQNPLVQLDAAIGASILTAVLQQGWEQRLLALQINPQSDPELSGLIVAAWYSGVFDGKTGPILVGYENTLIWSSVPFMHVIGYCGGDFGYWAGKP